MLSYDARSLKTIKTHSGRGGDLIFVFKNAEVRKTILVNIKITREILGEHDVG